ncbi:hypothetical protein BCO9919_05995 [Burkholderia cenocepacia]|uniref:Uncharacterized protein n=1 Tax=Burkholderia cenocepacia TaxID=95486 RepID=A0A6J5JNZ6_9BURK|nr:hypothetical protein BCO9919_05995 [Burkholderia cenocepacia]
MQESWQNYALLNTPPVQVGTNGSIFSGTGFFVLWQTQEGTALFLVSNKHGCDRNKVLFRSCFINVPMSRQSGSPVMAHGACTLILSITRKFR